MAKRNVTMAILCALLLTVVAAEAQPLPKADPQSVGLSPDRLVRIPEVLKAEVAKNRIPGAVVAIARKGKLAYFEAVGFRDKDANAAMTTDAIFSIASMTKPMVSVAAMMLYEEGKLLPTDPVGKFLPAMSAMKVAVQKPGPDGKTTVETVPAVRQPTIQDLLRHTSGITYGGRGTTDVHKMWPASSSTAGTTYTAAEFIQHVGKLPLLHQPGTVWDYSLSTDVLGLVVEAVSGKPLGVFLSERIWKPLGMADTGFTVPEAGVRRYARAFANDPLTGKPQTVLHASGKPLRFECGGGCAVSTAADYLRFTQMLLNRGALDGTRIVARKTVEYMTADHLGPEIKHNVAGTEGAYGFGLGFAVRKDTGRAGAIGSAGAYTWGGAAGTFFWVDPKEELAVLFMSHAPGAIRLYYRQVIASLVYQAIAD